MPFQTCQTGTYYIKNLKSRSHWVNPNPNPRGRRVLPHFVQITHFCIHIRQSFYLPLLSKFSGNSEMEGWDPSTKSTLTQIPLLTIKAGPRDGAAWTQRLKEEYKALIAYTSMNKSKDNDWFRISAANPEGTRWKGKCWYVHNLLKYEFDLQFDIPVTYPATAPELELPEIDGKTEKMYRGGKICLTVHFKPLWAKNCPRFGIAHALCLGLAPWLAAEIPVLVDSGMIKHKDDVATSSES